MIAIVSRVALSLLPWPTSLTHGSELDYELKGAPQPAADAKIFRSLSLVAQMPKMIYCYFQVEIAVAFLHADASRSSEQTSVLVLHQSPPGRRASLRISASHLP